MIGTVDITGWVLRAGSLFQYEAGHIGYISRFLPTVEGIYGQVVWFFLTTVCLYQSACFIKRITTQWVGERKSQVKPFIRKYVGKTSCNLRIGRLIWNGLCFRCIVSLFFIIIALLVLCIEIVESFSGLCIYSGKLFHVKAVVRKTYFMDKPGALDWLLHIAIQRYDLITIVGQVQHGCPVKVNRSQF